MQVPFANQIQSILEGAGALRAAAVSAGGKKAGASWLVWATLMSVVVGALALWLAVAWLLAYSD
jgi:hypothetical protein